MRRHSTESRCAPSEGRCGPGAACSAMSPRSPLCPGGPRGGAKGFVSTPLDQTTSMVLPSPTVHDSHIPRILSAREKAGAIQEVAGGVDVRCELSLKGQGGPEKAEGGGGGSPGPGRPAGGTSTRGRANEGVQQAGLELRPRPRRLPRPQRHPEGSLSPLGPVMSAWPSCSPPFRTATTCVSQSSFRDGRS